jgi:hypothetical protein
MKTSVKLAAYLGSLAAVFAAAAGAGSLVGPVTAGTPEHEGTDMTATHAREGSHTAANPTPKGLQVSQDGYTMAPAVTTLPASGGTYSFRILDRQSRPVTGYERSHDKDLHLIVVRRDMAGFAHVHPAMSPDGTWSIPLRPGAGSGVYRVFADFTPAGHEKGLTLGADLSVAGEFAPRALPEPQRTVTVDGYTVTLTGDLRAGTSSKLTLSVTRNGAPVTNLQPYLGAYGHLVALRTADLAYLHVHPDGTPGDGATKAGPDVTFYAEVPSSGGYRLFLDFQHGGVVRTAEFTATAGSAHTGEPAPAGTPGASPASEGHGHDD